jgi:hypothetical protein
MNRAEQSQLLQVETMGIFLKMVRDFGTLTEE